jgi:hypothetical protein
MLILLAVLSRPRWVWFGWAASIIHPLSSAGTWIDTGMPKQFSGLSAVATGDFTFMAVMYGEDAKGSIISCLNVHNVFIQPGGKWSRD